MSKRNKNTPDVSRPGLTFGGNRRKDFRLIRDVEGNESWMLDQPEYKIGFGEENASIHIKAGELLSLDKDGLVRPLVAADLEYDSSVNFVGVSLEVGDSGETIHVQNQGEFVWDRYYVKRNGEANEEFASVFNNPEYEVGQQIYLEYDNNVGFTNVTKEPKEDGEAETEGVVHEYPNIVLTIRKKKYFQYTKQYAFGIIREKTEDRVVVELNISKQELDDQLIIHNVELGEDITINETCDPIAIVLRSKQCYKQKPLVDSIESDVLDFTTPATFQNTVYTVSFEEKVDGELAKPYTDNDFIIVQYGNRAVIARLGTNEEGGHFSFEDDTIWDKDQQSQYDTAHITNLKNQGFNFVDYFTVVADKRSDSIPKEIVIIDRDDGASALIDAIELCSSCEANYIDGLANRYLLIRDHSIIDDDAPVGMDFANYYECPVTVYFSSSFYSRGNNITRIVEGGLSYENVGFRADFRQSEEDVFGLYFPRHNLKPNDVLEKGTIIPVTTSGKVLWNNTDKPKEVSWKNIDLDQTPVDIKKELFCGLKGQLMNLPTNYWNGYIWCVGRAAVDPAYNEDYFEVRIQRRTLNTLISSVGSIIPCDYDDNGSPIISNGYLLCDGVTPQPKKTYLKLYEFLKERFGANQIEHNVEEPDEYFIVPKFGFANGYGQILATPIAGFLNVEKNFFVRQEFDFDRASFSHVMDITPLFYKGVLLDEMESTPLLTSLDVVVYHKQSDGSITTLNYQTYYNTGNSIGFSYKVYCKEGRYYMRVSGKAYNALQGAPRMIDHGTLIVYAFQKKYAGVEYVDLINKMPSYLGNIHSTEELYQKGHDVYEALKNTTLDGQSLYDLFNEIRNKFTTTDEAFVELSNKVDIFREDIDRNADALTEYKTEVEAKVEEVKDSIKDSNDHIQDANDAIQEVRDAIAAVAEDVNTHYVKDDQFEESLSQIKGDVHNVIDKTNDINDTIISLESDVRLINEISETLSSYKEAIDKVDDIEESVVNTQGRITNLDSSFEDLEAHVDAISTECQEANNEVNDKISSVNSQLANINATLDRIDIDNINTIESMLNEIRGNIEALDTRVETIETDEDLKDRVSALEARLSALESSATESQNSSTNSQGSGEDDTTPPSSDEPTNPSDEQPTTQDGDETPPEDGSDNTPTDGGQDNTNDDTLTEGDSDNTMPEGTQDGETSSDDEQNNTDDDTTPSDEQTTETPSDDPQDDEQDNTENTDETTPEDSETETPLESDDTENDDTSDGGQDDSQSNDDEDDSPHLNPPRPGENNTNDEDDETTSDEDEFESSIAYKRILAESLPLEKEGHITVDGEKVEVSYADVIEHDLVTGADEYSTEELNDYPTNKDSKLDDRDYNFQRGTHGDFVPEQEQADAYSIDVEVNGTTHTIYFQTQEEAEEWVRRHFDKSSEFGNDSPRVVTVDPSKE